MDLALYFVLVVMNDGIANAVALTTGFLMVIYFASAIVKFIQSIFE